VLQYSSTKKIKHQKYSSTKKTKHQKQPLLAKSSGVIQVWWQQNTPNPPDPQQVVGYDLAFMNISSPEGYPVSMELPRCHFWDRKRR
jgi:hypothetical protein